MLGFESTLSIGKQVSFVDPTTLPRQLLAIYSITGGMTSPDSEDKVLTGSTATLYDPAQPAPGLDDHRIQIKFPICLAQIPFWLCAFFGAEQSPTGSSPNYVHTWKSGGAPPILFIEHKLKTGLYRRHYGMYAEQIEFDFDAERDGYAMATMDLVGLKTVKATSALPGTITAAPTLIRPAQKLISITYDGVAGGSLMGGKLTYKRPVTRKRSADGTGVPYAVELQTNASLDGSLRTRFDDDSFYDDAETKTEAPISYLLQNNANLGFQIDLAHARLSLKPVDVPGADILEYSPDYKAWASGTDPAILFTVKNSVATFAL